MATESSKFNFLKKIDIFGNPNLMRIKKHVLYKTHIGGIFTIIYILIITAAFVGFGIDIFKKEIPSIISSTFNLEIPEFSLMKDEFIFNLMNYNSTPFTKDQVDKLFQLEICYNDNNSSLANVGKQYISSCYELIECKKDAIPPEFIQNLAAKLNTYFCFPPEIKEKRLLYTYGNANSKVLRLNVNMCRNSTKNNNSCFSEIEIQQNVDVIFMHIVGTNTYIENSNYMNPIKKSTYSNFIRSTKDSIARFIFWYKNISYYTDEGLIFKSSRFNSSFMIDHIDSYIYASINSKTYFSHIFSAYNYPSVYERSYIKIQGILAMIGGFINSCKIIIYIFIEYLNKPYYYREILNALDIKTNDSSKFNLNYLSKTSYVNNPKKLFTLKIESFSKKSMTYQNDSKIVDKDIIPFWKNLFRLFLNKKGNVQKFYEIEDKFNKYYSVECYFKMKRKQKILNYLILADYQKYFIKFIDDDLIKNKFTPNAYEYYKILSNNSIIYSNHIDRKLINILNDKNDRIGRDEIYYQ